jgi:hypothetical protein
VEIVALGLATLPIPQRISKSSFRSLRALNF